MKQGITKRHSELWVDPEGMRPVVVNYIGTYLIGQPINPATLHPLSTDLPRFMTFMCQWILRKYQALPEERERRLPTVAV